MSPYAQDGFLARFDWAVEGAEAVAPGAAVVAVVDVLSFTTTLTVAVDLGVEVYPYPFRDDTARAYAARRDAVLAVGRAQATGDGQVTLSPASVRAATGLRRLVLPSPNGSTIARRLAGTGAIVVAVGLRNVDAAAEWVAARLGPRGAVAAIAGGERRPDGSLRPAVEDLWGAGAFLDGLAARGVGPLSPEAQAAAAAYREVRDRLPASLWDCASGRELREYGYPDDVRIAAEVDASRAVPVLDGDRFVGAT